MDVIVETAANEQPTACCPSCGASQTHMARVRSAFWQDDRLVVVEDIPALVCDSCGEQAFDDNAVVVLDLLRGEGFPADEARAEMRVPVFSFNDRLAAQILS